MRCIVKQLNSIQKADGFTLIELMITVAVVGILSALAIPSYNEYILRSHRSDAKNAVLAVAQRLEQNYTIAGTYAATQAGVAINDASIVTWGYGQIPLSGTARYSITFLGAAPAATTFTLVATPSGAQAGDSCGTLTLDNRNLRSAAGQNNRGAKTIECWSR